MLSIFKKPVQTPPKKPLSLQVTYSSTGNNTLFQQPQNTFANDLFQHLSFTQPQKEQCTLIEGARFIGFSKKTGDSVVVFPISVQQDPAYWQKLITFAEKNHLAIGEFRLNNATNAQTLTKDGRKIYIVSPTALQPCAKLYPKLTTEHRTQSTITPAM